MKPTYIILAVSVAALTAIAAVSADSSAATLSVRYLRASELHELVAKQLGATAASAITAIDLRANALQIDPAHPDAAKVRDLVTKLDERPPTVKVQATIKRITAATPTSEAREQIVSRPTLFGRADQPFTISFGDAAHDTFTIELVVTPTPE
jgi:hypothetical protein